MKKFEVCNGDRTICATCTGRETIHGEYIVRLSLNGKPVPEADYFTDDYIDAIGTAKAMVLHEMKKAK